MIQTKDTPVKLKNQNYLQLCIFLTNVEANALKSGLFHIKIYFNILSSKTRSRVHNNFNLYNISSNIIKVFFSENPLNLTSICLKINYVILYPF